MPCKIIKKVMFLLFFLEAQRKCLVKVIKMVIFLLFLCKRKKCLVKIIEMVVDCHYKGYIFQYFSASAKKIS